MDNLNPKVSPPQPEKTDGNPAGRLRIVIYATSSSATCPVANWKYTQKIYPIILRRLSKQLEMLKLSVLIIFLMVMTAQARIVAAPLGEQVFLSEVVECSSVTQGEIFRRARIWAVQVQPDAKILVADKDYGDLAMHCNLVITLPRSENSAGGVYQFRYVLVLECINRKYRAAISNVELVETGTARFTPMNAIAVGANTDILKDQLAKKLADVLGELKSNVKFYQPF